jgi:hypothetical protein
MNETFLNLLNEEQDPKSVEKIYQKVSGLLTSGEEIQYIAVQKKPAVNISPDCIALTNKRIIFCRPKNFGFSMDFEDYQWKDVADVHIKEGILGAEFKVKTVRGSITVMDYLPKAQARKLYQFGQEKEEENREFRRLRDLEDKRAIAGGGITVNTAIPQVPVAPPISVAPVVEGPLEKLKILKMMFENQLISQEEYDTKKAELLSKL